MKVANLLRRKEFPRNKETSIPKKALRNFEKFLSITMTFVRSLQEHGSQILIIISIGHVKFHEISNFTIETNLLSVKLEA